MTKSTSVPMRLVACAAFMTAVFACCHLAGLRETTSLLCRIDIASQPTRWELFGLGLYLASYVAVVLVAPILTIAAVLSAAAARIRRLAA